MKPIINLENFTSSKSIPAKKEFMKWAEAALTTTRKQHEINIRIVSPKEITKINSYYRHKNKPTNIISFPFAAPKGIPTNTLGDMVICAAQVKKEAIRDQITFKAHWAHLTVHGVLHLLGYDHITSAQAKKMEAKEIRILKKLGFSNPYN